MQLSPPPTPGLPFYCFLSQHPVACQECDTTQNGQVLESLEHVELSPVDIHEPQHCCEKTESMAETVSKSSYLLSSEHTVCCTAKHLVCLIFEALKMADVKIRHHCQGKKVSESPHKKNVILRAHNQPSCGRIIDRL